MPEVEIVYGAADGDTYHASADCAPEHGTQLVNVFALQAGMEPCGVCRPQGGEHICDECGRSYKRPGALRHHRADAHMGGDDGEGETLARYDELAQKARGESDA